MESRQRFAMCVNRLYFSVVFNSVWLKFFLFLTKEQQSRKQSCDYNRSIFFHLEFSHLGTWMLLLSIIVGSSGFLCQKHSPLKKFTSFNSNSVFDYSLTVGLLTPQ